MKRSAERPVLITSAERSQDEQRRSREIRYVAMMLFRIGFIVLAGVLVGVRAPLLVVWLPLCGVCMVLIPWLAVLLANDRPPREEHRVFHRMRHRNTEEPAPRAITGDEPRQRVIDPEP